MKNVTANQMPDGAEPTLDDMLAGLDAALAVPEPIGQLYGHIVYLHHDSRELSWGGADGVRCSVDNPYLAGTAIRDAALNRLGGIAR